MPSRSRILWSLTLVPIGTLGAWWWLQGSAATAQIPEGQIPEGTPSALEERSNALARARLSCRVGDLDAFIAEQRGLVASDPSATELRILAEALYERILTRNVKKGLAVGTYVDAASYEANRSDIEEGLALLGRARSAGDTTAESDRLEAAFLSSKLTSLGSVLANQPSIRAALDRAIEKDPRNGHAHVALGCQHLFAPSWLGQNIEKAIEHFRFAARALPLNERPQLLVAFGRYLQGKKDKCIEWLERAAERNPRNPFVAAVLKRLRRGEAKPFARDL